MLPYFNINTFHLGPFTIHTWGLVVAIGFTVAIWVAYRRAQRLGLSGNRVLDLSFWILVAAFIGARLFHVFIYEWSYYSAYPGEIIRIDQGGLSSFGGFIGAVVAFWVYMNFRIISTKRAERTRGEISHGTPNDGVRSLASARDDKTLMWRYADILMFAWPLGHGIGRLGCFLVHMHPGRLSSVPWAVDYPGGARLDMGLIEAVYHFLMFGVLLLCARKPRQSGFYVLLTMTVYGAVRFFFDFFRATDLPISDTRYLGLTPAQYGSIILVALGLYLWCKRKQYTFIL